MSSAFHFTPTYVGISLLVVRVSSVLMTPRHFFHFRRLISAPSRPPKPHKYRNVTDCVSRAVSVGRKTNKAPMPLPPNEGDNVDGDFRTCCRYNYDSPSPNKTETLLNSRTVSASYIYATDAGQSSVEICIYEYVICRNTPSFLKNIVRFRKICVQTLVSFTIHLEI